MSEDVGATGDMASAVEAAFSAAATPAVESASTTTTSEVSPSAAPVEHAVVDATSTTQEPGPIPYGRFKEVNDRANRLKWAEAIPDAHAADVAAFYQRVSQNPLALLDEVSALMSNPQTAPAVRSWAARTLGTRMANAAASGEPELVEDAEPLADIPLDDGRALYSDTQQRKREAWLQRQWEAKLDARLQPIQATTKKVEAERVYAEIQQRATRDGSASVSALLSANPVLAQHKTAMRDAMLADPKLSLEGAALRVLSTVVGPASASAKASALQQKVGAGSANPSRPSGAVVGKPKDFTEALQQAFAAR